MGTKKKSPKYNLNDLAKDVANLEEGVTNLSIAQIKEVLTSLGVVLAGMKAKDSLAIIARLVEKGG